MIIKIEVIEKISTIYSSELSINVVNKNVTYSKGDTVLKNSTCDIDVRKLDELLKGYITYWNKEYIDESIIDGRTVEIVIYTDRDVITYYFKNEFPEDLEEFIKTLKRSVGIDE